MNYYQICSIIGFLISNYYIFGCVHIVRFESTLVDIIVDDVIKKLKDISMARDAYLQGLVGVTKHIDEIESLLHISSLDVLTIGI